MCSIKGAFVGKKKRGGWNFNVIKMHGTTIKNQTVYVCGLNNQTCNAHAV